MVRVSLTTLTFNNNIKGGSSQADGDGVTTIFTIAHGMNTTPTNVSVEDKSVDAIGARIVNWDATNITITYSVAPIAGTNNLLYSWTAIKVIS